MATRLHSTNRHPDMRAIRRLNIEADQCIQLAKTHVPHSQGPQLDSPTDVKATCMRCVTSYYNNVVHMCNTRSNKLPKLGETIYGCASASPS